MAMTQLSIFLLGPFQVTLNGEPVTRFGSDTARALLAYLAMHPGTAHRRDALAGLLWPEQPDAQALRNLRVALSRLRGAVGDRETDVPLLHVTRRTIQLVDDARCALDVRAMREALAATKEHGHAHLEGCGACTKRLQAVADLYRGEFLAGFSLDSAPFEEWMVVERESLHWQALEALYALAAYHEAQGEHEEAIACARRQVELEPWREAAHRQWMRALALSGRRGAALAQYEACRQVLADELGVEPEVETATLYEQIRTGALAPPKPPDKWAAAEPRGEAPPPSAVTAAPKEMPLQQYAPSPASLGQGVPEGERRTVAVVQAEISGSTALLSHVDAEDWATFVSRFLRAAGAEVHRLGGEVDRYDPQGLVALFGAQTAHEDDPERAVLAALAMQAVFQAELAQFAQSTEGEAGWEEADDLGLRVGVHTGEAIVTVVEGEGGRRGRRAVIGDAVSAANRMLDLIPSGEVRVSEATRGLVEPLFEWGSGEKSHCPLAHKALPSKGRGIEGLSSPLVGRDAEFRALQEAVTRLRDGIGGIVTLVGDAGIGKSRLAAEVRTAVGAHRTLAGIPDEAPLREPPPREPPPRWVEGRCLSYATGVAYSLWLDLLRGLLSMDADAPPETAAQALRERVGALCAEGADEVYPFLARMMSLPLTGSAEARLRGVEGEGLQVLTFRAVETLVELAAQQTPLVLACEDLHWADPTSLALLEHLLPLTDHVPVLVICVLRPEKDHGCWRIREAAERRYGHRHTGLSLDPLTERESTELVGHLLHVEDLPQGLRARILGHAEGNPFYVEEILRSLIDAGVIVYDEATDPSTGLRASTPEYSGVGRTGRWGATRDVADIPLPDTLRGVLMARIDRLPREARHVLQLAAVIGRFFAYPILSAIASPRPEGEGSGVRVLDDDLVTLQRGQMIRQRTRLPEAAYMFKHQLTQEAAYEGLLRRKRRVLHRRVAEAVEQLFPERVEEQPGLLAHHWERAGEVERAIPYLRRAGEQAAAQFANAEAVAYFGRALDLLPQESVERYTLLLARERVYELMGDREAQGRDLATLKGLAEAHGDKAKQAEVAVRRARYLHRIGEHTKASTVAQAAVRLAQAAQNVRSEAMAYREWGRVLGGREERQRHLERALALARDAGLRQVEAEILHTLGLVLGNLGDRERQMDCWEQGLRICRQIGDRRREGEALRDVGFSLCHRGNWTEAEGYLRQSLNICRETGNRRDEAWALQFLGGMSNYRGNYAQARNSIEHGLRICREIHDRVGEREALWYLGYTHMGMADYATARDCLEQSLHIFREMNRRGTDGWVLAALGLVFHLQGDYASAGMYYEQALHIGRETDRWFVEARALMYTGLLSHHLGDDSAAREYSQHALSVIPNLDTLLAVELISVFDVLGHALAGLGCPAEAADAYRQALTLRRQWGQHHLAAEPLAGLARVALAQGDPARALAHVQEILDYLDGHPALLGTLEPLRIYMTCYRVLLANRDPRAGEILHAAYHLLQERAAKIDDENLRRSYLENVAAHREIAAEYAQATGQDHLGHA
jgi:predicted ATPase/DNA-binding SARP family transcriptional activator/class 3 adenylate cyclase